MLSAYEFKQRTASQRAALSMVLVIFGYLFGANKSNSQMVSYLFQFIPNCNLFAGYENYIAAKTPQNSSYFTARLLLLYNDGLAESAAGFIEFLALIRKPCNALDWLGTSAGRSVMGKILKSI